MGNFVHLHVHTEYSLLDGALRIPSLVSKVKELGMDSVAITDHGAMYGVVDFYKECMKQGVKPILGCEVYTAPRTRFDKDARLDAEQGHLILLAKNNQGYKNLMKLVSAGFIEGFYYKPRIDMELLEKYHDGLICLSACVGGDVPQAILNDGYNKAKELALRFEKIFGRGNYYLELQQNGFEEQKIVNQALLKLSRETGIPLVATNDVHYLNKEDARAQEILMCIQTAKTVEDEDRMRFSTDELYLKSPDVIKEQFHYCPEAIENTVKIADMCNTSIEFGKLHLPEFDVPGSRDAFEYLKELCESGFKKRYCDDEKLKERLNYELNVIHQMGYVDYFLIVWDFIRYARENRIMVGPGRGSAAGSMVAYCLGITNVDPIKYQLIFERFLNPERISMPDIDIDFCFERRGEVIDYVVQKYGKERVAQIITFGTMAARAAIRDVGRALAIPYAEVDKIAKMVPMQLGMTIEKALELNPELRQAYENDHRIHELINTALLLEGMPRHASTHAAGVVISKDPITEYVPLYQNEGNISTQFPMTTLEELGLLKMDFLGLRTLTVIRDTVKMAEDNHGIKLDLDSLEMNDPEVFNMIGSGDTAGVFQLESAGMTQFMTELKPTSIEDIIAGISLYRPGPMDQIPRYIRNKNNPESIHYAHPLLKPILSVTYGCMVYQEQVMQIVRDLGGYSLGRSDLVRRAMSKKKKDVMEEERQKFVYGETDSNGNVLIPGAIRNGVDEKTANEIFDEMMDFASYAFNKSHAAAYAVVGYQTAWLKRYYTVEFMAALLNSFMGTPSKISQYVLECRKMGIQVLPPDINESAEEFSVTGGKIRFGLAAIKNVGSGVVKQIILEREKNGPFTGLPDFCERLDGRDLNKRCVESLIKSGAFDSLKIYRSRLINSFESIMDNISHIRKMNMEGQLSFFEKGSDSCDGVLDISYPEIDEYDSNLLLAMEKDMLGLYLSGHPLSEYEEEIKKWATMYSINLITDEKDDLTIDSHLKDGEFVRIAGIVTDIKTITTRSNQLMAFVTIEDLTEQMEIIVFPGTLEKYGDLLKPEFPIWIEGKLSVREDEAPKLIAEMIKPINKGDVFDITKKNTEYKEPGNKYNQFSVWEPANQYNRIRQTADPAGNGKKTQGNISAGQTGNDADSGNYSGYGGNGFGSMILNQDSTSGFCLKVRIPGKTDEKTVNAVVSLLKYFEGTKTQVYLYYGGKVQKRFRVFFSNTLFEELISILGESNVKYERILVNTNL